MKINYEGGPNQFRSDTARRPRLRKFWWNGNWAKFCLEYTAVNVGNDDVNSDVAITRYSRGKPPSNCICWSVKANPNVVLCPAIFSSSNFIKTWVEKVANNNKLRKFIDGKCESSPMDDDELHTVMKYQNQKVMMWKLVRKPVNEGQTVKVMENVVGEHQFDDNSCQLTTYRR